VEAATVYSDSAACPWRIGGVPVKRHGLISVLGAHLAYPFRDTTRVCKTPRERE